MKPDQRTVRTVHTGDSRSWIKSGEASSWHTCMQATGVCQLYAYGRPMEYKCLA